MSNQKKKPKPKEHTVCLDTARLFFNTAGSMMLGSNHSPHKERLWFVMKTLKVSQAVILISCTNFFFSLCF